MLPFLIPLITAGAGAIAQGIGSAIAAGDEAEARRLLAEAAKNFKNLKVPTFEELAVQAQELGPSALQSADADPFSVQAQRRALTGMMGIAEDKGMDAEMRANLEGARQETARQEQAQRGAILDQAQQRGMGGSGITVQSQLMAQQGSADRNSMAGTQAAAEASRRALTAMAQGGQLAGQARSQSWQEQSDKARAADEIDRFNAQMRDSTNRYNAGAKQQVFDNEYNKAAGQANTLTKQATDTQQRANGARDTAADIGSGVADAIRDGAAYWTDPNRRKR